MSFILPRASQMNETSIPPKICYLGLVKGFVEMAHEFDYHVVEVELSSDIKHYGKKVLKHIHKNKCNKNRACI